LKAGLHHLFLLRPVKVVRTFCIACAVTLWLFAAYICGASRFFADDRSVAKFAAIVQPLEAFSTALAFVAIVIVASTQSKELRQTKRETADIIVRALRLQASSARLISMSTSSAADIQKARRELEVQVEQLERWLDAYHRDEA
jgi:hypothetical protein